MPYPQYTVGCAGLLLKIATGVLAEVNASLSAMVTSGASGKPAAVALKMGRLRSLGGPMLSIIHAGEDEPVLAGQRDFIRVIRFKFIFLVPQIGDDLPENFEMARQVTADVLVCRLDDVDMLTPKIDAGSFGSVSATLARRGRVSPIDEFVMPDGATTAEGFQLTWEAEFPVSRMPLMG